MTRDGCFGSPGSPAEKPAVSCSCPAGSDPAAAGMALVTEGMASAATMVSVRMMILPRAPSENAGGHKMQDAALRTI